MAKRWNEDKFLTFGKSNKRSEQTESEGKVSHSPVGDSILLREKEGVALLKVSRLVKVNQTVIPKKKVII